MKEIPTKRYTTIVLGWLLLVAVLSAGCEPEKITEHKEDAPPTGPVVKGRLLYSDGSPADRVPVVLRNARIAAQSLQVSTGKDGRFLFGAVPKGRYRFFEIRVYVNAKLGKCEVMDRRSVSVGADGLDLGTVKLKPKIIPPTAK